MSGGKANNLPNADVRIKEVNLKSLHILGYDVDNGYPQRMRNLVNASRTAKSAVGLYAKFMRGGSFADKTFFEAVVNDDGLTPDGLLSMVTDDLSIFRGVGIHFNYNQLYEKTSVDFVPFENIRISSSDDKKYNNKFAISEKWVVTATNKKVATISDIDFIDKYDPTPEAIERQVVAAGGWDDYQGQIMYFTFDYGSYPLSSCDSIIYEMKTEEASSKTTFNNVKNNFSEKTVFTIGDEFETEAERLEYLNELKTFVGPDGASVLLVEGSLNDKNEIAAPVISKIPNTLNDKIFQYSDEKTVRGIIRAFNQPGILHTDTDTSALGKDDLIAAATFYNKTTSDERIKIERLFSEIFSGFHVDVNPDNNYTIVPYTYFEEAVDGEDNRLLIDVIGIGGVQAMQAILADPAMTSEQKRDSLMIIFGLNEENANKLSGIQINTE